MSELIDTDEPFEESSAAFHTLEGYIRGLWMDGQVNSSELEGLRSWVESHQDLMKYTPFDRVFPLLETIMEDGSFDSGEYEQLLWELEAFKLQSDYLSGSDGDLRSFFGMLQGILSDDVVSEKEIRALNDWLKFKPRLQGVALINEIQLVIEGLLRDDELSEQESHAFLAFLRDFILIQPRQGGDLHALRFEHQGQVFLFSGISDVAHQKGFADFLIQWNSTASDSGAPSRFLVVSSGFGPVWVFASRENRMLNLLHVEWQQSGIELMESLNLNG